MSDVIETTKLEELQNEVAALRAANARLTLDVDNAHRAADNAEQHAAASEARAAASVAEYKQVAAAAEARAAALQKQATTSQQAADNATRFYAIARQQLQALAIIANNTLSTTPEVKAQ